MVQPMTAKKANDLIGKALSERQIKLWCFLHNHYGILGLPAGEKTLTDEQIWVALCKRQEDDDWKQKLVESKWDSYVGNKDDVEIVLLHSYYILMDGEMRAMYECWWVLCKGFEKAKFIIDREKNVLPDEYVLCTFDECQRIGNRLPFIYVGHIITLPVRLSVRLCYNIVRRTCKAIQSIMKGSGTGGECSSGGEQDIQQDWVLVNEDDYYS